MRQTRPVVALFLALSCTASVSSARSQEPSLDRALALAARLRGVSLGSPETTVVTSVIPAGLSAPYRAGIARIAGAIARAEAARVAARSRVTDDEIAFAERIGVRATIAPGTINAVDAARAVDIVARIDTGALLRAAASIADAVRDARPLFTRADAPAAVTCDAAGWICVGTDGNDTWPDDVQVIVDPAGDDLYLNNSGGLFSSQMRDTTGGCVLGGGTTGRARPNLDCTPAPSQICTYDTLRRATGDGDLPTMGLPGHEDPSGAHGGEGNDGSCGSDTRRERLADSTRNIASDHDSRGVSLVLDLDGSDTYTWPWSHDDPLFNLNEICHPGDEAARNTDRDFAQGAGLAGVGILWDSGAGDDVYRGRLNVQGSGHVGGVGILFTDGSGSSTFWADRLSQGSGIAGGVGILVNTKDGTSSYMLDPPLVYQNEFRPNGRDCQQEGRAGQGEGGFGGVGILWNDHDGSSTYRSVAHVVRTAPPFDPILDAEGAPVLVGGSDAQGSGESFPISDTPGGLVIGAGLLFDHTDHASTVCAPRPDGTPASGMLTGATMGEGHDVATFGSVAPCGKFNLPAESTADDLDAAARHLVAGAAGLRVVI